MAASYGRLRAAQHTIWPNRPQCPRAERSVQLNVMLKRPPTKHLGRGHARSERFRRPPSPDPSHPLRV